MTIESEFVRISAETLLQFMGRIETCIARLTPEQIWQRHSENENAVGNLLLHLNGNLRQWVLHGIGGAPDERYRDGEFAAREGVGTDELVKGLRSTVNEVVTLIRALPEGRLLDSVNPQGYDTTVLGAIYHVVEHFSGHTFQIILLTKFFTSQDLGFYAHLSGARPRTDPLP